jgi:leucyl-tRNA synthetase
MELFNEISRFEASDGQGRAVVQEALEAAVILMAPITPHISHDLWKLLGHTDAAIEQSWPEADVAAMQADTVNMVVQVNGKVRAKIEMPADAENDAVEALALADAGVQKHIGDATVRKVIVVKGRLVNIVAK